MTLPGKYLSLLLAAVCVALSVASHPAHRVYRLGPHGSPAGRALPGEYGGVARDNIVFTEGLLRPGDELYFDYRLSCVGETDVSVSQEVTFMHMVGNFTYVQVTELGASQNATASIVEGGLACWYLTVNVLSDLSRGYDALIEVYGSPYFRGGYGVQEVSYDDFSRLKREEICEDP